MEGLRVDVRVDVRALVDRARRKLAYVVTTRRERALVADAPVVPVSSQGRWHWYREHPRASRAEVRRDHLRTLTDLLDAHDVSYFVVPDTLGLRPQIGVLVDDHPTALRVLAAGLAERAWYATTESDSVLLDRLGDPPDGPLRLHPRYRVAGTVHLAGPDLGVSLVPWRREGGRVVPTARNDHVEWLRVEDLEPAEVEAFGACWRSVAPLHVPHAAEVAPLTWVIDVPRPLRRADPALADQLSAGLGDLPVEEFSTSSEGVLGFGTDQPGGIESLGSTLAMMEIGASGSGGGCCSCCSCCPCCCCS